MDETVKSSNKPKKNIGHYEIKSELGRGGMATVYLGYDKRFERDVAVKVLPAEFLHDPQFSVRFHREAKIVAALEHPAIVPVYDVGVSEEGLHYFVMRYMDGGSLADKLAEGEISLKEVARIIDIIAPALDDAHAKGIVHRDLKPANILFDHRNRPYLSDFGIAKISDSQHDVTGSAIIGTPAYMSPEQAQGKKVDGRSDIYALGAIIYRMLTGTRPYNGDTPMSMAIKHITDPTPDILKENPDLPPSATNFIYRAMEKDPEARFQTAVELAEALNILARSEDTAHIKTISSHKQSFGKTRIHAKSVPPKQKKKKTAWIVAGIAIVVVVGLLGLGLLGKLLLPANATERAPSPTTRATSISTPNQPAPVLAPTEAIIPSNTPLSPTETPAPEIPALPVIGGADKIAFIRNNDIWMMNVDGSDLVQLTEDNAVKSKLQWLPDRKTLIYIVGTCIKTVDAEENIEDVVTCIEQAEYFDAIQISPSGEQIAISMNRELFILPFDLEMLKNVRSRDDLKELGSCFFDDESVLDVRWSNDEKIIAMRFKGVSGSTRVDLIRTVDMSNCQPASVFAVTATAVAESPEDDDYLLSLNVIDEFPSARFTMSGYNGSTPYIPEFDWDGEDLFLMNSFKRNDGYGYFYAYNTHSHKAEQLDPAGTSTCCYRDARWSPDGSHFIVAYQDIALGPEAEILLYYLRFGTIGAGATYTPIPLPEGFFSNLKEKPQFALRPAN